MDDRRRAMVWDALVVATLVAVVATDSQGRLPEVAGGSVLATVVVLGGRRWPLAALLSGASATLSPLAVGTEFRTWPLLVSAVGCLLAGRRMAGGPAALLVFSAVGVAGMVGAVAAGDVWRWVEVAGPLLLAGVLPWLVGRYRRLRVALVESGWRHAAHLEQRQRLVASEARLRERARIARDMHDSLGHELSLLTMRAGGLELDPKLPEPYRTEVGQIRAELSGATEQLRAVIGVLHDDTDTMPATAVAAVVARARSSGVDVDLTMTGAPNSAPPMVERTAYRVVQEALTNAIRHAPGAAVTVRLAYGESGTLVMVANEPPPQPGQPRSAGSGSGLAGLAERVRLAGGTLHAGERDGGYEVVARLPGTADDPVAAAAEPEPEPRSAVAQTSSEAVRRFGRERRAVRRDLLAAAALPVVMGSAVVLVLVGLRVHEVTHSYLPPVIYEELRVGQSRSAIAEQLPSQQVVGRPQVPEPAIPTGSRCEYYRPTTDLFAGPIDVYRLCFADGVLVDKGLVPGRAP